MFAQEPKNKFYEAQDQSECSNISEQPKVLRTNQSIFLKKTKDWMFEEFFIVGVTKESIAKA